MITDVLTHCGLVMPFDQMASQNIVNAASSNSLFPDGTKPLAERMLTNHKWDPVAITWGL